jgi:hypothetical protein
MGVIASKFSAAAPHGKAYRRAHSCPVGYDKRSRENIRAPVGEAHRRRVVDWFAKAASELDGSARVYPL